MPEITQLEKITVLTPSLAEQICAIFPEDHLKQKRARNLNAARYILAAKIEKKIVGALFIRHIFGIPNATWVVDKNHRRQGIAFQLLQRAQKDYRFITAVSRNLPSAELAKKAGFRVFPFGLGIWIGFGTS